MTPTMKTVEDRSDAFWDVRGAEKWNTLVAWYLSASVAYYHWNESFLPDDDYDILCGDLHTHFDELSHPHAHLLDKDALMAGTGFHIKLHEYPAMTRGATWAILHPGDPLARTMPSE